MSTTALSTASLAAGLPLAALGLAAAALAAALAPRRRLDTSVFIDAPPAAVWAVLADGAGYAAWNPFIRSMTGPLVAGARLTNVMHPAGGRPMTFRPVVLAAEPGRELRWRGRLWVPRLFDGEHHFRLAPEGRGTRLDHGETFRGLLLWFIDTDRFRADFTAMNAALNARVEQRPGPR